MPKKLHEIKGFHVGTVSSPDSKDVPDDSNVSSTDLDNYDSKGTLKGRKSDQWYKNEGGNLYNAIAVDPNFAKTRITLVDDQANANVNLFNTFFFLDLLDRKYYVWFSGPLVADPATIPVLQASNTFAGRTGIAIKNGASNLTITHTAIDVAGFIKSTIDSLISTNVISGITVTNTAGTPVVDFTSTKVGDYKLSNESSIGLNQDIITFANITTGQGIHGDAIDATNISHDDKDTLVWWDRSYGVCRLEDMYSSNKKVYYQELLDKSDAATSVTISKNNKETHIGLGKDKDPKWAGYLNIGNQVNEKDTFKIADAELFLPGGEFASSSRDFNYILNHSQDSANLYAIVKGQSVIHRINIVEGNANYGLIETSAPLGYAIECITECKSDSTGIYIWAYTKGSNYSIYEADGYAGYFLKIKVNDDGTTTTFPFDRATLEVFNNIQIQYDSSTKLVNGTNSHAWQGEDNPEDPEVISILETSSTNLNGSGTRYMLWFMLGPKKMYEAGNYMYGTVGAANPSPSSFFYYNYNGDQVNSYLYSTGFANESGSVSDVNAVLTFYDRSVYTSAYETRLPEDSHDNNLQIGGTSSANNLYYIKRKPNSNSYYAGIKAGTANGTIKQYGAFDVNWSPRTFEHIKFYFTGTGDADFVTTDGKSHYLDVRYNQIGTVDKSLNPKGYYSDSAAVARIYFNNTDVTYSAGADPGDPENYTLTGGATTNESHTITYGANGYIKEGMLIGHANIPSGTRVAKVNSMTEAVLTKAATATGSSLIIMAKRGTKILVTMDNTTKATEARSKICTAVRNNTDLNPTGVDSERLLMAFYDTGSQTDTGVSATGLQSTILFLTAPYKVDRFTMSDLASETTGGNANKHKVDNSLVKFSDKFNDDDEFHTFIGRTAFSQGGAGQLLNESNNASNSLKLIHSTLSNFSASSGKVASGDGKGEWVLDTNWAYDVGNDIDATSATSAQSAKLRIFDHTDTGELDSYSVKLQPWTGYTVKIVVSAYTGGTFKVRVGDSDYSAEISGTGTYYLNLATKDFSENLNGLGYVDVTDSDNNFPTGKGYTVFNPIIITPASTFTGSISSVQLFLGMFNHPPVALNSTYNTSAVNTSKKLLMRSPGIPMCSYGKTGIRPMELDGSKFLYSMSDEIEDYDDVNQTRVGGDVYGRFAPVPYSLNEYNNGSLATTRRHTITFGMGISHDGFSLESGNYEGEGTESNDLRGLWWNDALYVHRVSSYPSTSTNFNWNNTELKYGYNLMRENEEFSEITTQDSTNAGVKYRENLSWTGEGSLLNITMSATDGVNSNTGLTKAKLDPLTDSITDFEGRAQIQSVNTSDSSADYDGTANGFGVSLLDDNAPLNTYFATHTAGTSSNQIDNADTNHFAVGTLQYGHKSGALDWSDDLSDTRRPYLFNNHPHFTRTYSALNIATEIGRKILQTSHWAWDGHEHMATVILLFTLADATSTNKGKLRGGIGTIIEDKFQYIVCGGDFNREYYPPTTGEGVTAAFSIANHAFVIEKYAAGGMDPYESSVDDEGSNYHFKLKGLDSYGSKRLVDFWWHYDTGFDGLPNDLNPNLNDGMQGHEQIGLHSTNSGATIWGHRLVNSLDTFIKTTEDGTADATGVFTQGTIYTYKISFTYDGYQESPLSASEWRHTVGGSNVKSISVTFMLDFGNPRITHINLYRVKGGSQNNDSLYRLAGSYQLKSGWLKKELNGKIAYQKTEIDDGLNGATYEAINGISELITSTMVNYGISEPLNDHLYIGRCYSKQIQGGANYIFKSKRGNFNQFDWSRDFAVLPEYPTAMGSYRNRLYVFSRTNMYILNQMMQIEETYKGIGCLSQSALASTEKGICVADDKNIHLISGSNPIAISASISDKYLEHLADGTYSGVVAGYHPETSSFLFNTKPNTTLVYNTTSSRWDTWTTPDSGAITKFFNSGRNELLCFGLIKKTLSRMAEDTDNRKSFNWTSKKFTMNADTQKKTFKSVHVDGFTSDKMSRISSNEESSLSNNAKQNLIGTNTFTYNLTGSKKKSIWLQLTISNCTDEVSSIGIIYRIGPIS